MSSLHPSSPLRGIRVLDFTHAAAGPFATMWLADLGAEVIKIEKPGRGDGSRFMGESLNGSQSSDYFASINRNKRDILIDLHAPEGSALARRLVAECDVVVQNFRPGVMERLGLGFQEVAGLRRSLVYCSISAFGDSGPWRDRPANDIIMQGITGLMALTGEPDGDPVRVGTPMCDFSTGLFGLSAILAALIARPEHPEGQHVLVNMFDSTIAMMANYVPAILSLQKIPTRQGRGHAQLVPYQAFRCADGQYLIVGAFTDAFWRRLCEATSLTGLLQDPRFTTNADRIENRGELIPKFEEAFAMRERESWMRILQRADVPATPVFDLQEALSSEQADVNRTVVELAGTDPVLYTAALPIKSSQWPEPDRRRPPTMGVDTAEILYQVLGMTRAEIDGLAGAGTIGLDATAPAPAGPSTAQNPA